MSKGKMVRIRMTTSSTAARAGAIVERQEAEAKRLIAAGYAESYEPVEYATRAELEALAERVTALEGATATSNSAAAAEDKPEKKSGKGK